jgi:hypothetical protein
VVSRRWVNWYVIIEDVEMGEETEKDVRVELVLCKGRWCLRCVVVGDAENARFLRCSPGNRRQRVTADFTDTFVKPRGVPHKGFHTETLLVTGKEAIQ